GNYSLKDTRNLLAQKGLLSKNGKVLTISNTQMILKNPFYYGMFLFNKELYQGKHEPAISKKLFDKCAEVSARNAHPMKRGINKHVFRGIFLCEECGCGITSEVQKGHTYYRCTKKKGVCTQKYIREEFLAEQVSGIIKKVSLLSEWKEYMLAELDKEQASSFHSDELFVQNLKNQIKSVEETLDRLLDAHLDSTITSEEYIAKKQKLLNQKIDFSEKLKDFERKGNRWLELSKQFILDSSQGIIIASEENLEAKRDFLQKIGSNPRLASRSLLLDFKNPWAILSETPVASLCDAPHPSRRFATLRILAKKRILKLGWGGRIRTFVPSSKGLCPTARRPPNINIILRHNLYNFLDCPPGRNRTCDHLLKRELLYQLSYGRVVDIVPILSLFCNNNKSMLG
ncbi:MAG: Recombinase, partial [Candidatus Giovannonibacteria bacterium GW2011_GWB1_43_13]